jgi:hypothetical protein
VNNQPHPQKQFILKIGIRIFKLAMPSIRESITAYICFTPALQQTFGIEPDHTYELQIKAGSQFAANADVKT